MARFLTAEQLKKELKENICLFVKYILLDTGEFRFCSGPFANHSDMIDRDKEKAVSAGTLKMIWEKGFCFDGIGSYTLKINPLQCSNDEPALEKLLGMKYCNKNK